MASPFTFIKDKRRHETTNLFHLQPELSVSLPPSESNKVATMTHPYVPRARVYRPSYGNVLPQTPAALQPNYNAEVNRIPINPRRHTAANIIPSQQPQQQGSHLHPLIHRTTRAYDLVINYARDSNGGTRWSYEDIDDIKHVGKYLHRDVLDLKYWKELVTNGGDMDEGTARRIWDDEERLKKYCERVLDAIGDTERLPLRQRMTQDEEMDEGSRESEYGVDDGKKVSPAGGN